MDIQCTQCGAKVGIEVDSDFLRCPYCETALYVETDRTVRHLYHLVQVKDKDLAALIQRKLAYQEVKETVVLGDHKLIYFPFWRLVLPEGASVIVPAATPPVEAIFEYKLPTGELKVFSAEATADFHLVEPELLLEDAVREGRALIQQPNADFDSAALVHIPLHVASYTAQQTTFTAVIDAVSGEVYGDEFPAGASKEKDRVLGLIALVALIVFTLEAALIPALWIVIAAYAVTAAAIYYYAHSTLKKMGW